MDLLVDGLPVVRTKGEDQLVLTTGRVLQHCNSGAIARQSGTLMKVRNENALQIDPQNAENRGIGMVILWSWRTTAAERR